MPQTYEQTVRHIRAQYDARREGSEYGPLTDLELANVLISLKYFPVAEWWLERMHQEDVDG